MRLHAQNELWEELFTSCDFSLDTLMSAPITTSVVVNALSAPAEWLSSNQGSKAALGHCHTVPTPAQGQSADCSTHSLCTPEERPDLPVSKAAHVRSQVV
ncbi:hypothetical protein NDU88_002533 [Pleurodeles waltl]|uniref:Uncharacterized protein n=1 Tax=Pleurodeles waltl TaxID=8319 RepID=A0AAV7TNI1_PLEWA|nr:hypothetical protein NDU88_002533 [Pleurodeles waltl]